MYDKQIYDKRLPALIKDKISKGEYMRKKHQSGKLMYLIDSWYWVVQSGTGFWELTPSNDKGTLYESMKTFTVLRIR